MNEENLPPDPKWTRKDQNNFNRAFVEWERRRGMKRLSFGDVIAHQATNDQARRKASR